MLTLLAILASTPLCEVARATENGLTHVDLGYFAILGGFGPPPGQAYLSVDAVQILTSRFNDRDGNPVRVDLGLIGRAPVKFLGNTTASVVNAAYEFPTVLPFLGARVGTAAYAVFAGARTEAQFNAFGTVSGAGRTIGGISDTTFVPFFLQWDMPGAMLHFVLAPTQFTAPTGSYDVGNPAGANVGTNYFSYRPALATTYLGAGGLELDLNLNGSINGTNPATRYRSGSEVSVTYAAIQHLSPALGVGVEGYYYRQVTGDRLDGVVVNTIRPRDAAAPFDPTNQGPGNEGQVFAIGPAISYNPTAAVNLNVRYQHEVFSDNRRQGEVLWAHASIVY